MFPYPGPCEMMFIYPGPLWSDVPISWDPVEWCSYNLGPRETKLILHINLRNVLNENNFRFNFFGQSNLVEGISLGHPSLLLYIYFHSMFFTFFFQSRWSWSRYVDGEIMESYDYCTECKNIAHLAPHKTSHIFTITGVFSNFVLLKVLQKRKNNQIFVQKKVQ